MTGTKWLPATPDVVWAALNDADCLQACVPGCRSLDRTSRTDYVLSAFVSLGPVRVVFEGTVGVSAGSPGESLNLQGKGQGGVLGDAFGTMRIVLRPTIDGCTLTYSVDAEATGPLSALGPLFLTGLANVLVEQFLLSFRSLLEARASPSLAAVQPGGSIAHRPAARGRTTISSSR